MVETAADTSVPGDSILGVRSFLHNCEPPDRAMDDAQEANEPENNSGVR
jgi:hypothetical protein